MALLAATGYQVTVVSLPRTRCLWRCRCAAYSEDKRGRRTKRDEPARYQAHWPGMPLEQQALANDHGRAKGTSRRPPRYPSRLHNAWTASSRSTRPAVHARSDRWSCLQGCGRAADAKRLHAAQLSAATKGCPDPAALSRGSPAARAATRDALVTRRAARRRRGRFLSNHEHRAHARGDGPRGREVL